MEKSGSTGPVLVRGLANSTSFSGPDIWSGSNNLDLWSDVVEVISFLGCYLKLGH